MAFKLTASQVKQLEKLTTAVSEAATAFNTVIGSYNDTLPTMVQALTEAQEAYNETLEAARVFLDDVKETIQEDYEDMSDKWKEGFAGGSVANWIEALSEISIDDVEIDLPEPLDEIDPAEHAGALEDLPHAPG
jgi:hypothetical protein